MVNGVAEDHGPAPWGTPSQPAVGAVSDTIFFISNAQGTRALLAWDDTTGRLHSRIAMISGNAMTWGDDTYIAGANVNTLSVGFSANGQVAIAGWRLNGASGTKYAIAQVDDSVVRWGTPGSLPSNGGIPIVAVSDDGTRVAVAFTTDSYPYPLKVRAGSVSGGAVTWSSDQTVSSADVVTETQRMDMSADGLTVAVTYPLSGTYVLRMAAATVTPGSPPSVSAGTPVTVSSGGITPSKHALALSADGHRVASIYQDTTVSPNQLRTRMATISGNTVTLGATTTNGPTLWTAPSVSLDDSGSRILAGWQDPSSNVLAQVGQVDDSVPVWDDSTALVTTGAQSQSAPIVALSSDGQRAVLLTRQDVPAASTNVMQAFAAGVDGDGASWNAGQAVSNPGSALLSGTLTLSGNGNVAAAGWMNLDHPTYPLFANVATLAGPAPVITGVSPSTGSTAGGTSVTVSGAAFVSGATVSIAGSSCVVSATTATSITCTTPAGTPGASNVTVTNPDLQTVTLAGGFTYVAPAPPTPPPTPIAPTAPRGVVARAGDGSAALAWQAPESSGSFAVSTYLATASPGGRTCLATETSCVISGLTNGTTYTFTVQALSGAGWSAASAPSNAVTPRTEPAPQPVTLVISGSRSAREITINGAATEMGMGALVTPWSKRGGDAYEQGAQVPVSADGTFTWSRRVAARSATWSVYVTAGTVRSNVVVLRR